MMKKRLIMYFIGLFIMTAGIALSVKSDLGVSPVSSIPYTMTLVWGIEMGKATILFHCMLVLIQICILRKNFKIKNLLQIPVGIVFGYFTTFCNYLVSLVNVPNLMIIRLCMLLISVVLIAFGIFLYLPADIMPLAGEGVTKTVSDTSHIALANVKIIFDVSMVTASLIICLAVLHRPGSVGGGTVAAAILVGMVLSRFTKYLEGWRDRIIGA